jgi:hypothetical protein
MILTANELAAVSSAVAALGILGGYLGVRSANGNAVKIAREERSTRRRDELNDLKRATYARFLAALTALAAASLRLEAITAAGLRADAPIAAAEKREAAFAAAHDIAAELDLLAPGMHDLAADALDKAHGCTRANRSHFSARLTELRTTMRRDLPSPEAPNFKELDSAAHARIGIPDPSAEIKNLPAPDAGSVKAENSLRQRAPARTAPARAPLLLAHRLGAAASRCSISSDPGSIDPAPRPCLHGRNIMAHPPYAAPEAGPDLVSPTRSERNRTK